MNILVHGFNVRDPKKSTGKLHKCLDECISFNYGWRELISVMLCNKRDAKKLKDITMLHKSNIYAHSNGCAISVESARQGAKIKALICINPALKRKTKFPPSIDRILVIHTKHDKATKAARFFDRIPFIQLLIPNAWGAMGAKGYSGDDKRVVNWDLSITLKGHSDFFEDENLDSYMGQIKEWIDER